MRSVKNNNFTRRPTHGIDKFGHRTTGDDNPTGDILSQGCHSRTISNSFHLRIYRHKGPFSAGLHVLPNITPLDRHLLKLRIDRIHIVQNRIFDDVRRERAFA